MSPEAEIIVAYLKKCAEAALCEGDPFNLGVIRGLEIAAAQVEHGHHLTGTFSADDEVSA